MNRRRGRDVCITMNATDRNGIELVVFDLGGVLVRLCDGWPDACRRAGVPSRVEFGDPAVQRGLSDAVDSSERGRIDLTEFCRRVGDASGLHPDHVRAIVDGYLRGLQPGVAELFDQLDAAAVPTACLSNTNARHWALMFEEQADRYDALGRFRHRFASHLIGRRKPEADIYAAVEQAVALPGAALVFFDDNEPNVAAARARGWHAFQVDPDPDPVAQMRAHLRDLGIL